LNNKLNIYQQNTTQSVKQEQHWCYLMYSHIMKLYMVTDACTHASFVKLTLSQINTLFSLEGKKGSGYRT